MTEETVHIEDVSLEEAQDIVGDWVQDIGGQIIDDYQRMERSWVRPNPWNPNKQNDSMYSHQLEVMRQAGQIAPIVVREVGPDNDKGKGYHEEEHFQILDGEHRWRSSGDLGWSEISANNLGVVPDNVAMMITVIMNHIRGDSDPIELGKLFKTLRDEADGDKKKLDRISKWVPFEDRQIDVLVDAVRNDKKSPVLPSKLRGTSETVKFTFKVQNDAAPVCNMALEHIVGETNSSLDRAFELMCADYLAGANIEFDDPAKPGSEAEFREINNGENDSGESASPDEIGPEVDDDDCLGHELDPDD